MKFFNRNTVRAGLVGLGTASSYAMADLPTEITGLFTSTAAQASLVVTAGIVAYASYRGGFTVLTVAKRMLGKAGL